MGQINVEINGRSHAVACDDGEEDHLMELAEYVAKQAEDLTGSLGQVADSRLLLMTALVISDELGDSLARIDDLEKDLEVLKSAKRPLMTGQPADGSTPEGAGAGDTAHLAEIIDRATSRVQDIAARVANG